MPRVFDRIRAALQSRRLYREARRVRGMEQIALRELGAGIPNAPRAGPLADVARRRKALDDARAAVAASLVQDRADYPAVRFAVRPMVILRGMAHRIVLREHVRRRTIDCDAASERLGEAALDLGIDAPAAERIRSLRAEAEALESRWAAVVAPYGGSPVPSFVLRVGQETARFARAAVNQLATRMPAIVGLLAGFSVATVFTGSPLSATLQPWGIGGAAERFAGSDASDIVGVWLPICAAALCSYGSARLGAKVRARYGAEAPASARTPPAVS